VTTYDAVEDPYCYPGTTLLKNLKNLTTQSALTRFETAITAQRFDEPLPSGRLSPTHFRAVHRHLFQDVYTWAGRYRTVRISKQGSMFCYPEHIDAQIKRLFTQLRNDEYLKDLSKEKFAQKATLFLSDLNAIHAFRDGNGRTQLAFMALVATQAGHPLNFEILEPDHFLDAMIRSFQGDHANLLNQLTLLTA
jgi:cell filamentation protein, protein adenylyltransferase